MYVFSHSLYIVQIINGYLKFLAYSNHNTYVIISQTMTSIVNRVAVTQRFHLLSKVGAGVICVPQCALLLMYSCSTMIAIQPVFDTV